MRIICSQCQTRFRVDDKYMTARGVRVQCPRCAYIELIKPAPGKKTDEHKGISLDAELDFSDLRDELLEEDAELESASIFQQPGLGLQPKPPLGSLEFQPKPPLERLELQRKPSLEGWELQPTQTIIGPSVHCQLCGKALFDSFDKALEICESCRNLPLKPQAPAPRAHTEHAKGVASPHVLDKGPLSISEEMESLTNQHTPPYAFESSIQDVSDDFPQAEDSQTAMDVELPSKRGIWFWLRWVFIGWGVAVLVVLLFLAVFR